MALTKADYIKPAKRMGLHHTPVLNAPEAASQTFWKGSPVIDASGYVTISGADPVTKILGIAIDAGQNQSSAGTVDATFVPALPGMVFEGALYHSSAASAVIAATDRFAQYGLVKSSTNEIWAIDKTESSAAKKCVTIVGFKDALSTANGTVYFTFNQRPRAHALSVSTSAVTTKDPFTIWG